MKKNAMLKIAAILMVAVLLTTCAISSTFAKYVSAPASITATTATTAKWGLTINAPAGNSSIFTNIYTDDNAADKVLVQLASNQLVLAPGTEYEGTNYAIGVEGTPEVAFRVTVDASAVTMSDWEIDVDANDAAGIAEKNGFYCPVVFTVGSVVVSDDDYTTAATYMEALRKAIAADILGVATTELVPDTTAGVYYVEYEANDDTFATATALDISWEWAFPTAENDQTDAYDTALGNKGSDMDYITIGYSVSAEQINAFAN